MKKELNDYYNDFSKFTNSNTVEEIWTTFKTKNTELMKKYIQQKTLRGNKKINNG